MNPAYTWTALEVKRAYDAHYSQFPIGSTKTGGTMNAKRVGTTVTYIDPVGVERPALVTADWGTDEFGSLNLVFCSTDQHMEDQYGRQIARATSVPHQKYQKAPGNYWK